MHVADVLHDEQQDDPAQAHDELAPLEVGRPGLAEQVVQLLVDRVVAWKGDVGQFQDRGVFWVGARAVAKNGFDLHTQWRYLCFSVPTPRIAHSCSNW